ncbi:MAG: hypothetical protein ABIH46_01995 [Chloroflexota bacterium]
MAEIIATFADGRFLVEENRLVEQTYMGSGIPVRIGHVSVVEKVLAIRANGPLQSGGRSWGDGVEGLITHIDEVAVGTPNAAVSGSKAERPDHIRVIMRRGDTGQAPVSGLWGQTVSGSASIISGFCPVLSGLGWRQEIRSGAPISGLVRVRATVIAR